MARTISYTDEDVENYQILTEVMQLEDLVVVNERYEKESNTRYLYCGIKWHIGLCPECGATSNTVHDYLRQREVHDVLLRGQKVKLVFDCVRLNCNECDKVFTLKVKDVVKNCSYTERLYEEISNPARKQDVSTLAKLYGVGYKLVESIMLKAGEAKLEQRREEPIKVKRLGIDEISQKKGKGTTS